MKVISLGAGVQSSTMLLMSCLGQLPKVDRAIFADTGGEPDAVYDHLNYLGSIADDYGIPVEVVKHADLESQLLRQDGRFGAIPWFIVNQDGTNGMGRRQCTNEYKLKPIRRRIRELLKKDGEKQAEMWIGISVDEIQRIKDSWVKYIKNVYPLIDKRMSRTDCLSWYNEHDFKTPPRSACVFCPFRKDSEWIRLKESDPEGFERAIEVDRAIRVSPGFKGKNYLHSSRIPLEEVEFHHDKNQLDLFNMECEGMCGI